MKCINCGNEKMRLRVEKKTPTWAVICAILFFPLGLFCLMFKSERNIFRCDECGYTYKEEDKIL